MNSVTTASQCFFNLPGSIQQQRLYIPAALGENISINTMIKPIFMIHARIEDVKPLHWDATSQDYPYHLRSKNSLSICTGSSVF